MRRAGVVRDQVHGDPDARRVGGGDQPIERRHAAEQGIDVPRVGDVVPVIDHGGDHHRVEPQRVDAECAQMVQVRGDAVEIADAAGR